MTIGTGCSNDADHATNSVVLHQSDWSREVGHEVRNAGRSWRQVHNADNDASSCTQWRSTFINRSHLVTQLHASCRVTRKFRNYPHCHRINSTSPISSLKSENTASIICLECWKSLQILSPLLRHTICMQWSVSPLSAVLMFLNDLLFIGPSLVYNFC